jgi:hypothetical protein
MTSTCKIVRTAKSILLSKEGVGSSNPVLKQFLIWFGIFLFNCFDYSNKAINKSNSTHCHIVYLILSVLASLVSECSEPSNRLLAIFFMSESFSGDLDRLPDSSIISDL